MHRQNNTSVVPKDHLDTYQPSVVIHDRQETSLERCSFVPSRGQVTCDTYVVDHVEYDENVDLKKFYVFKSQFDVQLFPDLTFVENNGRGGISFGSCKLIGLD